MRILLFTGKGGVGKSTVAAATALRTAEAGQRTLVCSTDPAHSLGDAFDDPLLGDEPWPIATLGRGSLFGQQLDARARLEESWGEVHRSAADASGPAPGEDAPPGRERVRRIDLA